MTAKPDIIGRTLDAGKWSLLDTVLQKVLIYGSFFITARLLSPSDFGIIAVAAIMPNLLDSLSAIAFDTALTQKKEGEERPFLHVVWTFNLLRSILVFAAAFIAAPFIARFFNAEEATELFRLAALPIVVQGLSSIGQIYFFRHLDWKKVFVRDMWNYGTTAVVTVGLASMLHSYWALFIGSLSGVICACVATYMLDGYRPRIDFTFSKLKPLLPFSEWVFGQALVVRLAQTIEDSTIGHFTSTTEVGFYTKAKSLAYAPTSPLANIIGKIGFSALVATGGDPAHVREGFYKSFDVAISVGVPFVFLIWIAGERVVEIILGPAWMGITPPLKLLVFVAALNASIASLVGMVVNATGQPKRYFHMNAISLASAVTVLPYLVMRDGIMGGAWALLFAAIMVNGYGLFMLDRSLSPDWRRPRVAFLVTLLSSFVGLPFGLSLLAYVKTSIPGFFIACGVFVVVYAFALYVFGKAFRVGPLPTLALIWSSLFSRR